MSEREAVLEAIRRLQLQHEAMEYFGARPETPIETCLAEVWSSDVVVVILGSRYGALVPGGDLSFSHAEYNEAQALGKPCLIYLSNATGEDSPGPVAEELETVEKLENWKCTLRQRHTCKTFRAAQDLALQVTADLGRFLSDWLAPPIGPWLVANVVFAVALICAAAWWIDNRTEWGVTLKGALILQAAIVVVGYGLTLLLGEHAKERILVLIRRIGGGWPSTAVLCMLAVAGAGIAACARTVVFNLPEGNQTFRIATPRDQRDVSLNSGKRRILLWTSPTAALPVTVSPTCGRSVCRVLTPFGLATLTNPADFNSRAVLLQPSDTLLGIFGAGGGPAFNLSVMAPATPKPFRQTISRYLAQPLYLGLCDCREGGQPTNSAKCLQASDLTPIVPPQVALVCAQRECTLYTTPTKHSTVSRGKSIPLSVDLQSAANIRPEVWEVRLP